MCGRARARVSKKKESSFCRHVYIVVGDYDLRKSEPHVATESKQIPHGGSMLDGRSNSVP